MISEGIRSNIGMGPSNQHESGQKGMSFLRGSEITSASRPKGRLPPESEGENERAGAVEEVGGSIGPSP